MLIRDRIKELRRVKAATLRPNPRNWRKHPQNQHDVMRGLLAEVGFAGALLVRELDDGSMQLIDGHLRAETTPDTEVPVLVLDVTKEEADLILATFDPVSNMAETDHDALEQLLAGLTPESDAVQSMLDGLRENAGSFEVEAAELPDLAAGERETMHTMNFTLSAEQENTVKAAIAKAKDMGEFGDTGNGNSNGNALARVCEVFLGNG